MGSLSADLREGGCAAERGEGGGCLLRERGDEGGVYLAKEEEALPGLITLAACWGELSSKL